MNLLNKFIRSAFWFAGTTSFFSALNFLGQILLAHILMPAQFGVYAFLFAVRESVSIFINFSSTQSFIYSEGKQRDFDACYYLNLIAFILYLLVALIGECILKLYFQQEHNYFFATLCLAQGISLLAAVYLAPIEKDLNYKRSSWVRGLSSLLGMMLGIGIAYSTHATLSLAFKELLQSIALFIMAWLIAPMRFKFSAIKIDFINQLSFGLKNLVSRGFEVIYYSLQDIVINFLFGKQALGNFYQARYLSNMPLRLSSPFTQQVLFSFFTNLKTDRQRLSNYLFWVNYVLTRAMLPVAMLVFWLGTPLFTLIYGKQWVSAGDYFRFFSFYLLFCPVFETLIVACLGLKKQEISVVAYIFALLASLSGMVIIHDPVFISLFFSLGFAVGSVYIFIKLRQQQINFSYSRLLYKPLFCFVLMIVACNIGLPSFALAVLYVGSLASLFYSERYLIKQLYHRFLHYRRSA